MKIRFRNLQDNLRANLWARLEQGGVTGKTLAHQAGFQQSHLSNFLNAHRGLSLHAMDRLLDVLHMDVLDLTGLNEARLHSRGSHDQNGDSQVVAVVSLNEAGRSIHFSPHQIHDTRHFANSYLRQLKPKTMGNRRDWTRFVVVQVDEENAESMSPILKTGALLLIDRHSNWLSGDSKKAKTMYVVRTSGRCIVRYVTDFTTSLSLRPENHDLPLESIPIPAGKRYGDFIVGRVCHLAMDM